MRRQQLNKRSAIWNVYHPIRRRLNFKSNRWNGQNKLINVFPIERKCFDVQDKWTSTSIRPFHSGIWWHANFATRVSHKLFESDSCGIQSSNYLSQTTRLLLMLCAGVYRFILEFNWWAAVAAVATYHLFYCLLRCSTLGVRERKREGGGGGQRGRRREREITHKYLKWPQNELHYWCQIPRRV